VAVALLGGLINRAVRLTTLRRTSPSSLRRSTNRRTSARRSSKLRQDYPPGLLEADRGDASSDGTDDIVRQIAAGDSRVQLLRNETRAERKTSGLNLAIRARADWCSPMPTLYRRRNRETGGISPIRRSVTSGRMLYVNADGSVVGDGCSLHALREFIARRRDWIGSIVGVDGGVDAIRRTCTGRCARTAADFVAPLTVAEQGFRVIYEPTLCSPRTR
jgi:hypothetical protein